VLTRVVYLGGLACFLCIMQPLPPSVCVPRRVLTITAPTVASTPSLVYVPSCPDDHADPPPRSDQGRGRADPLRDPSQKADIAESRHCRKPTLLKDDIAERRHFLISSDIKVRTSHFPCTGNSPRSRVMLAAPLDNGTMVVVPAAPRGRRPKLGSPETMARRANSARKRLQQRARKRAGTAQPAHRPRKTGGWLTGQGGSPAARLA